MATYLPHHPNLLYQPSLRKALACISKPRQLVACNPSCILGSVMCSLTTMGITAANLQLAQDTISKTASRSFDGSADFAGDLDKILFLAVCMCICMSDSHVVQGFVLFEQL